MSIAPLAGQAALDAADRRRRAAIELREGLLRSLEDPDERRSLALRLRLDRIHARQDAGELAAFPDQYKGDGLPQATTSDDSEDRAAAGPPSPLESLGISGRGTSEARKLPSNSDPYDIEVESETAAFRYERALSHLANVKTAYRHARIDFLEGGRSWAEVSHELGARVRWHKGRALGALRRFATVQDCGGNRIAAHCVSCGVVHDHPARCSCGRLCVGCAETKKNERIERLDAGQARVMKAAGRLGLLRDKRKGGRWSEKFVTLTVPHFRDARGDDPTVKARVEATMKAWARFRADLREWCRVQEKTLLDALGPQRFARLLSFYRGFEWTPGHDSLGHPHFHLWVFSPFLPKELVAVWWTSALEKSGLPSSSVPRAVVKHAHATLCAGGRCEGRRVTGGGRVARSPRQALEELELLARESDQIELADVLADARRRLHRSRCLKTPLQDREEKRPRKQTPFRCALGPESANGVCLNAVRVDVRSCDSRHGRGATAEIAKGAIKVQGGGVVRYVEGWSLVTLREDGERIAARTLARLYEVLDRRRLTATSKGLIEPIAEGCSTCGAVRTVRVDVYDPRLEPHRGATGPPSRERESFLLK